MYHINKVTQNKDMKVVKQELSKLMSISDQQVSHMVFNNTDMRLQTITQCGYTDAEKTKYIIEHSNYDVDTGKLIEFLTTDASGVTIGWLVFDHFTGVKVEQGLFNVEQEFVGILHFSQDGEYLSHTFVKNDVCVGYYDGESRFVATKTQAEIDKYFNEIGMFSESMLNALT